MKQYDRQAPGAGVAKPFSARDRLHYLDRVSAADFARDYKRQSFALLEIGAGERVLDLGCGPGDDVLALAERVGAEGAVIGLDQDPLMIAEAGRRAVSSGLPVSFVRGDAHRLGFAAGVFDCCRADRVFEHLAEPLTALAELVRVAKPGARVLVIEPDWETVVLDAGERSTTRRVLNFICDRVIPNGWMGRRLPGLFRSCALTQIGVMAQTTPLTDLALADQILGLHRNAERAVAAGVISAQEAVRWLRSLEEAQHEERFFAAITGFAVSGRKP